MTGNNNISEAISKRSHCFGMCGGRGSRAFCGIFFIIVGLFWMGKEANLLSPEVLAMFWPLLFIGAGIWFVAASLINKERH